MTNSISGAIPISQVLTNVLEFLLSIVGVVAIIGLVVAGFLYLTAAGDEHRIKIAKLSFYFSLIGGIVALSALVIINTLTNFLS